MNFLSIFGAGKSEKKKKKNKRSDRVVSEIYALKGVTMRVSSLMVQALKNRNAKIPAACSKISAMIHTSSQSTTAMGHPAERRAKQPTTTSVQNYRKALIRETSQNCSQKRTWKTTSQRCSKTPRRN
jgi:hypothetical protein